MLIETPSFMDTSLPDLLPITRQPDLAAVRPARVAGAAADPCAAVNRGALDAVIEAIAAAFRKADDDVAANGPSVAGARYPAATTFAQAGCQKALDTMQTLLGWLDNNGMFEPPDDRVTNATASFNIFGYCREAIIQLHYARHWAAVSSSSNVSQNGTNPGRDCTELLSVALSLTEPLSADATGCYLREVP